MPVLLFWILGAGAAAGAGAAVAIGNAWEGIDNTIEGTVEKTTSLATVALVGGGLYVLAKWKKII